MNMKLPATLLLLILIPGCVEDPISVPETNKVPARTTDSAALPDAVTFADSEALQKDCGEADEDFPKDFQTTASGLKYRILRKSDGQQANANNKVTVDYRGWLDDGTEFDSSYGRGEPTSFPLKGVIPGWTEGMQLVGLGGMIELWIPPDLGYGADGAGAAVPPNATLHFVVELLEVQ